MFWARAAIQANPEMVQHLIPAAQERFVDAQAAFIGGSATGTVYLAGSLLHRSDAEEFLSRAGWFMANANAIWR